MSLSKLGPLAPAAALSSPMKNHHRHHQYERHYQPAPCGIGPAMMCEMIKRNDLLRLSETVIKPFYYQRVRGNYRHHSPLFTGKSLPDS